MTEKKIIDIAAIRPLALSSAAIFIIPHRALFLLHLIRKKIPRRGR
jgi:hypothetical protein